LGQGDTAHGEQLASGGAAMSDYHMRISDVDAISNALGKKAREEFSRLCFQFGLSAGEVGRLRAQLAAARELLSKAHGHLVDCGGCIGCSDVAKEIEAME